jgi:hypothetical protein
LIEDKELSRENGKVMEQLTGKIFVCRQNPVLFFTACYESRYLVPFLQVDVGDASEPLGCSSQSIPNSPTYTRFGRLVKYCDITLTLEVFTRLPILSNQV